MWRKWMVLAILGIIFIPGLAGAVDKKDFLVDTTRDLISLCTAPEDDPLRKEAIHFCVGYLVGAYHYYVAENSGPGSTPLICPPDPPPSRAEVGGMFIDWVKKHPEYLDEEPVETWFRFLVEKYPCN